MTVDTRIPLEALTPPPSDTNLDKMPKSLGFDLATGEAKEEDVATYISPAPFIPERFEDRQVAHPVQDTDATPERASSTLSAANQFQHVWGVLQRRRDIIDRVFNIRANRANLLVYESLAEENHRKLERDDAHRQILEVLAAQPGLSETMKEEFERRQEAELLIDYHRKRIEGQMREAIARAEYAQEKIAHWALEIRALRATFFGRKE